ncbi:uncharacterized protein [Haliotis asinina]|uniref:uncharacterized protein n=1 Tax=Haliotis asinina TaxID=109174 RepID=UPI003531A6A5
MSGDKKPKMCPTPEAGPSVDGEVSTPLDSIPHMAGGQELGTMPHMSAHDYISKDPQGQQQQQHLSTVNPMSQQQFLPYLHTQPSGMFPMATGPPHFDGKRQTDKGGHPGMMATGYDCTPYQGYQLHSETSSQQQLKTSGAPVMIVQQQHYYKTANFHEAKGVQGPVYQDGESPLNNIKESTKALIKSHDMSSQVSTFVERYALRTMKRLNYHGSLFIKGRHGTGKSKLGLHLLSKLSKESKRTPLVLTLADDWHLIPKTGRHSEKIQRKYLVMIDDMFGSSNFSKTVLDKWEKLFDLMWPTVESGLISLIVTSRTDIFSKCHCRVMKYKLMKNMIMLDLDGKHALRPTEKNKLFLKHCSRLNLKKEDIQEIVDTKTCVGFPRCCELFARRVKDKKRTSNSYAYDFLTTDVSMLRDNDQLGYLVLLLILMKGCLDAKMLDNPPKELKNLIEDLSDTCISLEQMPNCRSIKDKANELSDTCLKKSRNIFEFEHTAISDAVFLDAAQTHLAMFLDKCSVEVLVKFVRVGRSDTICDEEDESLVYIDDNLQEVFIERVVDILMDDRVEILNHPCFSNMEFVKSILDSNDSNFVLATKNIGGGCCYFNTFNQEIIKDVTADSLDMIGETSDIFLKETLFAYEYLVSFIIMKGLVQFANTLLFKQGLVGLSSALLNEALTCYIYNNNHEAVLKLLSNGTPTSADSIKALCCVPQADAHMVDLVFEKTQWSGIHNWTQLLSVAIKFGNVRVTKLLVDKMKSEESNKHAFAKSLIQLLYQTSGFILPNECKAMYINVLDLMNILLDTECSYDKDILLSLAAGHVNVDILKRLLEVTTICQDKEMLLLKYATIYGSFRCLEELLNKTDTIRLYRPISKQKDTLLHCAARSAVDSLLKIKLLMQLDTTKEGLGVNVTDGQNNTPLHFAALRGNVECVVELLDNGADVTCLNEAEVTALHCAALSNSRECMQVICQTGQTLSNGMPLYELCFHEPTRAYIQHYFVTHYKDLQTVVKTVSDRVVIENLKILLASKVDTQRTNSNGDTCLVNACNVNNLAVLKVLCKRSGCFTKTSTGGSLLHAAAAHGDLEMVEFLCEKGGDVRETDGEEQTVVHAAAGSSLEAAEKLYYLIEEKRAPVLNVDKRGRTALFPAAEVGDREVVEYLLEKKIDPRKLDKCGKSVLNVASSSVHDIISRNIEWLR